MKNNYQFCILCGYITNTRSMVLTHYSNSKNFGPKWICKTCIKQLNEDLLYVEMIKKEEPEDG